MKTALLTLLCLLFVSACADATKPAPALRPDPLPPSYQTQQIAIEGIGQYLVAGEPMITASTADSPMQVVVPLRSITDKPLNVQYIFTFTDQQGVELRSNPGWVFLHFEPYSTHQVSAVALESKAAKWRLMVRPSH